MIFEVVNDRGLGLLPYEILKGKLIGNLPVEQKEHANSGRTLLQDDYFNANVELKNSTEAQLDLEHVFSAHFCAPSSRTRKASMTSSKAIIITRCIEYLEGTSLLSGFCRS